MLDSRHFQPIDRGQGALIVVPEKRAFGLGLRDGSRNLNGDTTGLAGRSSTMPLLSPTPGSTQITVAPRCVDCVTGRGGCAQSATGAVMGQSCRPGCQASTNQVHDLAPVTLLRPRSPSASNCAGLRCFSGNGTDPFLAQSRCVIHNPGLGASDQHL